MTEQLKTPTLKLSDSQAPRKSTTLFELLQMETFISKGKSMMEGPSPMYKHMKLTSSRQAFIAALAQHNQGSLGLCQSSLSQIRVDARQEKSEAGKDYFQKQRAMKKVPASLRKYQEFINKKLFSPTTNAIQSESGQNQLNQSNISKKQSQDDIKKSRSQSLNEQNTQILPLIKIQGAPTQQNSIAQHESTSFQAHMQQILSRTPLSMTTANQNSLHHENISQSSSVVKSSQKALLLNNGQQVKRNRIVSSCGQHYQQNFPMKAKSPSVQFANILQPSSEASIEHSDRSSRAQETDQEIGNHLPIINPREISLNNSLLQKDPRKPAITPVLSSYHQQEENLHQRLKQAGQQKAKQEAQAAKNLQESKFVELQQAIEHTFDKAKGTRNGSNNIKSNTLTTKITASQKDQIRKRTKIQSQCGSTILNSSSLLTRGLDFQPKRSLCNNLPEKISACEGVRESRTSMSIFKPTSKAQKELSVSNNINNTQIMTQAVLSPTKANDNSQKLLLNAPSRDNLLDDFYSPSLYAFPMVSCKTYCIMDGTRGKILWSKGESENREIASLTKIMTAIVSLRLCKELDIDPYATYFKVSEAASQTQGTTAYLKSGQRIRIIDLLYGLMLPSGNDAAVTIAQNFGELIRGVRGKHSKQVMLVGDNYEVKKAMVNPNTPAAKVFVKEMNRVAASFHLRSTQFTNPHGLSDKGNKSTASDIASLAFNALKDVQFQSIVNQQRYECMTFLPNTKISADTFQQQQATAPKPVSALHKAEPDEIPYKMVWFNSNKLLSVSGFKGVKTGITQTAGPCLCILFENEQLNHKIITVVLGCKNIDNRFRDARRLTLWADNMLVDQKLNLKGSMKTIPLFSP